MSECQGENCTHPECTRNDPKPNVEEVREKLRKELGISPQKWAAMNRAERREAGQVVSQANNLACYCTCGSSLTGRANAPEALLGMWNEVHRGEGHSPTDAAGARAARRREERRTRTKT